MERVVKGAACLVVLALATAWATAQQGQQQQKGQQVKGIYLDPQMFVQRAAEINLAEIGIGTLAEKRAARDDIRQYGKMVATDHRKAHDGLKQVATKKGYKVPTMTDQKHRDLETTLSKLDGPRFDQEFLQNMIQCHQEAIEIFEVQANSGQVEEVRLYAKQTLPTLQTHLTKAKELQGKVGK